MARVTPMKRLPYSNPQPPQNRHSHFAGNPCSATATRLSAAAAADSAGAGGGLSTNQAVSPWGLGVSDWSPPAVKPGDLLVFRWFGETHDVQKFGDPVTYGLCSFFNTKQISPARPVGVRTWLSPWGFGMKDWKAPKVLPGDLLVFQWSGEVHSVHKVDVADYTACTFLNAKTLARSRNYGMYIYKVVGKDYGNTIYFSSKANNDCSDGIKASFTVG
ncbi:unnamed protein product [Closterium sp. NIES-53]